MAVNQGNLSNARILPDPCKECIIYFLGVYAYYQFYLQNLTLIEIRKPRNQLIGLKYYKENSTVIDILGCYDMSWQFNENQIVVMGLFIGEASK